MNCNQKILLNQLSELEKHNELLRDSLKFQEITLLNQIRQKNKYYAIYKNIEQFQEKQKLFLDASLFSESQNDTVERISMTSKQSAYDLLTLSQHKSKVRFSQIQHQKQDSTCQYKENMGSYESRSVLKSKKDKLENRSQLIKSVILKSSYH